MASAAASRGNSNISEKDQQKARAMSVSTTSDPTFNTPLIPASTAALTVHASTRIDAPASLVFRTLRNTDTWRDWNNFVPRVTIRSQPPSDDLATDAEIAELVLNTSRLGAIDSEITDGAVGSPTGLPAPKKSISSPPVTPKISGETERRASVASGKADHFSAASRFAQAQGGRRASAVSTTSTNSNLSEAPRPASPLPGKMTETSSPSSGGVLIHHSGGQSGQNSRKGSLVPNVAAAKRRASLNAMYGEPSVRLKVGTTMTFHCRMGLPVSPRNYKDTPLVVTEVSRPDEPAPVWDMPDPDNPEQGLTRVTTHTISRSGVYRIIFGTDHKAEKLPKFMLTTQWVCEVRPVLRGDGKEECEFRIWESFKGMSAGGMKKTVGDYLFTRFSEWVLGLRDYCEAMGGAVERKDFFDEAVRRSSSVIST